MNFHITPCSDEYSQTDQLGFNKYVNTLYDFIKDVKVYGVRAAKMKELFTDNGFYIVYDKDIDEPIANGFYFTVAYPGFSGAELVLELFYYGISTLPLTATGSERIEGIRICVSFVQDEQLSALEKNLRSYSEFTINLFSFVTLTSLYQRVVPNKKVGR